MNAAKHSKNLFFWPTLYVVHVLLYHLIWYLNTVFPFSKDAREAVIYFSVHAMTKENIWNAFLSWSIDPKKRFQENLKKIHNVGVVFSKLSSHMEHL